MRGVKTGGRAVDERLLETVEAFIKKHQNDWREVLSASPYNIIIIKDGVKSRDGLHI